MAELWDIYNEKKEKTGRTCRRGPDVLQPGEYHLVVTAIILNSKGEILIDKRAEYKDWGGYWECSGGSIIAGESSLEGILREVKEELGIEFKPEEAILLKEIKRDKKLPDFKDIWLFSKDLDPNTLAFPDKEVTQAKWVDIDTFEEMYEKGEIVPSVDFRKEDYITAVRLLKEKKDNRK